MVIKGWWYILNNGDVTVTGDGEWRLQMIDAWLVASFSCKWLQMMVREPHHVRAQKVTRLVQFQCWSVTFKWDIIIVPYSLL